MMVGFCAASLARAPVATPSAPAKGINGGAEVGLDLDSPESHGAVQLCCSGFSAQFAVPTRHSIAAPPWKRKRNETNAPILF